MKKKKRSTFEKITMIAIWLMLISMIGSLVFAAVSALMY
ncbi:MAG: DUF4044 domain-containing protein [Lactobacillus sp.]|jgi:cell division septal protein FtsQ|nr:DUF4044 domain-containing protein [Paucilactobacillus vaccinostercus]RRG09515.1 MAG: DUF4044 domain-containing protein [Lactobacillus sp.]